MSESLEHPAVATAIAHFRGRTDDTVEAYLVVVRGDIAAVALRNAESRWIVVVNHVNGEWQMPRLMTIGMAPIKGPDRNFRPSMLQRLGIHRSGPPAADGGRPDSSWITVSGFAAEEVRSVAVESSLDSWSSDVADDGFVLAVLRAPWREKPSVAVVMSDGRRVPCVHPSLG